METEEIGKKEGDYKKLRDTHQTFMWEYSVYSGKYTFRKEVKNVP